MRRMCADQLLEIIPYAALQFGSYASIKAALARRAAAAAPPGAPPPPLRASDKFWAGVAAGSAAKLALHPLDVAKKRLQVAGLARARSYGAPIAVGAYRGILPALAAVARAEGAAGLYKGLLPNVLKAAPASGITFVVYEALIALHAAVQAADVARRRGV
jgi:solute carrier family 25 thiamine pyrophosphate transporter 19